MEEEIKPKEQNVLISEAEYQRKASETETSKLQKPENVLKEEKKFETLIQKGQISEPRKESFNNMQTQMEEQKMITKDLNKFFPEVNQEVFFSRINTSNTTNNFYQKDKYESDTSKGLLPSISGQSLTSVLSNIENHNDSKEVQTYERILLEIRQTTNFLMIQAGQTKDLEDNSQALGMLEAECTHIIRMLESIMAYILLRMICDESK